LRKYEEEAARAEAPAQLLHLYQQKVLSFLDFLSVMKGRYHEATFKEQRNAHPRDAQRVYPIEPFHSERHPPMEPGGREQMRQ
jgi:hypothetical protein